MTATTAQPWFVPMVEDAADRPVTLYAFPQAGGGCSTFGALAARLGRGTALWSASLPGRQARFSEPPRTRIGPLVADLTDAIARRPSGPYALLGYCSGALLAFEVARAVRDRGLPAPVSLIAVSYPAPQRAWLPDDLHRLPADEFWAEMVSYGGMSATLLAQPDYREIFEAALRGDYALLADYSYRTAPPLPTPVVTITGTGDEAVRPDDVRAWAEHSAVGLVERHVDGGHWLLDTSMAALAAVVDSHLTLSDRPA